VGTQKNLLYNGEILKEFFAVGKAKLAYFARGKNLFIQMLNEYF
jgi:hypothetical protein